MKELQTTNWGGTWSTSGPEVQFRSPTLSCIRRTEQGPDYEGDNLRCAFNATNGEQRSIFSVYNDYGAWSTPAEQVNDARHPSMVAFPPPGQALEAYTDLGSVFGANYSTIRTTASSIGKRLVHHPPASMKGTNISPISSYPEPFKGFTTIRLSLSCSTSVMLEVFDNYGRSVAVLTQGDFKKGDYSFAFDGSRLPNGIYHCRVHCGNERRSIILHLIR